MSWFAPLSAKPLHTWLRMGLVITLCLLTFKIALVRDDFQHVARGLAIATVLAWAIPLSYPATVRNRLQRVAAGIRPLLAIGLTLLLLGVSPVGDSLDQWWHVARLLSPDRRAAILNSSREWIQVVDGWSPEVNAAVAGQRVIMEPVEIAAAWAHDLDWAPVPVIQSYAAFTPDLDRMNARDLVSDPDRVILREALAIDVRNSLWDSPYYTYVIACRFIPAVADARWVVLTHTGSRCGRAGPVPHRRARGGTDPRSSGRSQPATDRQLHT